MTDHPPTTFLTYKKSRFSTRLPLDRLYTAAHFWAQERHPGLFRIGFTKFATRMLGDLVEVGFEVKPESRVRIGQVIGWIECLKAASDLFCVVEGQFSGHNLELNNHPEWLQKDPYEKGWLFEVQGVPEPNSLDAPGYALFLDDLIAKMLGEQL